MTADEATAQAATTTRAPWWQRAGVILVVALAVRLVLVLPALETHYYSDEWCFMELADSLAAGRGFAWPNGNPTCYRGPAWPFVLSLVYRLTGPSLAAGRLTQCLLGTLLVGVVLLLAGAVSRGDRRVAALAGWLAACSPTLIVFSHNLFSETLFGVLFGLGLLALLRAADQRALGWAAAAGVALGLAALARASTLVFVPLAAAWLLRASPGPWPPRWRRALLCGGLAAVVIAPWTARNWVRFGAFIPIDNNGAVNLLYGNNPYGWILAPFDLVASDERDKVMAWRVGDPAEEQRRASAMAKEYIRAQPGRFVIGLFTKTSNQWGLARDAPAAVRQRIYGSPPLPLVVTVAAVAGIEALFCLAVGVLGLALAADRRAAGLQILVALYLTAIHAVSVGHSRYRFAALPLFYAFAALALVTLRDTPPRERWARLRAHPLAVWLAALLVANFAYDLVVIELIPFLSGAKAF